MPESTTVNASASIELPLSQAEPRVHQFSGRWSTAGDVCREPAAAEQPAVSSLEGGGALPWGAPPWQWSFTEFREMVLRAALTALDVRRAAPANQPLDDRFFR